MRVGVIDTGVDASHPDYVVLLKRGASIESFKRAVERSGGRVTEINRRVGVASVRSTNADFAGDVARTRPVVGAARNRPVGQVTPTRPADPFAIERMAATRHSAPGEGRVWRRGGRGLPPLDEPFADLQVGHADDPRHGEEVVPAPASRRTSTAR